MSRSRAAAAWLALGVVGAAPGAARPSDRDVDVHREELSRASFDLLLERQKRLTAIDALMRIQGAALCGEKLAPVLGAFAATRDELTRAHRRAAESSYGAGDRVKVLWVVPGHAADCAGLRAGDVVLEVGGRRISSAQALHARSSRSLGGAVDLRVERNCEALDIALEIVSGCYHPAYVVRFDWVNAFADGARIVIFSGIMRFVPPRGPNGTFQNAASRSQAEKPGNIPYARPPSPLGVAERFPACPSLLTIRRKRPENGYVREELSSAVGCRGEWRESYEGAKPRRRRSLPTLQSNEARDV